VEIPKSHYVYELAYPKEMPKLAGVVFYVGKGTSLSRMDDHLREAAREDCDCAKCEAIRSVWAAGLAVVRNIVFTSRNEKVTLEEEIRRIVRHHSPYLTNMQHNQPAASVHTKLKQLIAAWLEVSVNQIIPEASLIEDLKADSLSLVELVIAMEEAFNLNIPSGDMQRLDTVQDVEDYLTKRSVFGSSIYSNLLDIPD
jgi:acyl carrier protein